MSFHYFEGLKYYSFTSIESNVHHGIFSRRGGSSPFPWNSLNMGGTVGDEIQRVTQNRKCAFNALKLDFNYQYDAWQVHSTNVVFADAPRGQNDEYKKADIILTDKPGLTLMMRFADCTPIILHDPVKKVLGLVHAGWLGTVNMAAKIGVEAMVEHYGSNPKDIRAGIGPSIGPDHYQIGADVAQKVQETFGKNGNVLIYQGNGKFFFDLWEGNRILLASAGIHEIEVSRICTACNLGDWFSHRAEKGKTGRFGFLASLEN